MKKIIAVAVSIALLYTLGALSAPEASAETNWTSSTAVLVDAQSGFCRWQGHLRESTSASESETTEDTAGNSCTVSYARLYYQPVGSSSVFSTNAFNPNGSFIRASRSGSNESIAGLTCMSWAGWSCRQHAPPYWY